MSTFKDIEKRLDVVDVQCENCIHYDKQNIATLGYCKRYCKPSDGVRHLCVRTGWYAEMCILNAAIENTLK